MIHLSKTQKRTCGLVISGTYKVLAAYTEESGNETVRQRGDLIVAAGQLALSLSTQSAQPQQEVKVASHLFIALGTTLTPPLYHTCQGQNDKPLSSNLFSDCLL